MKTLVLTFSEYSGFNAAVTCPQDTQLFVTFNKHEDLIEWLDAFIEPSVQTSTEGGTLK